MLCIMGLVIVCFYCNTDHCYNYGFDILCFMFYVCIYIYIYMDPALEIFELVVVHLQLTLH